MYAYIYNVIDGSCSAAVQCPALEPPKDGQVFFTSTSFEATAVYNCHVGFVLVGNEERTCTADGTWSGSLPFCRREFVDIAQY